MTQLRALLTALHATKDCHISVKRVSVLGRDEDLFRLPLPPSTGLLLIFMIEKHTSIFRALQSNQGVAATPPIQVEIEKS